VVVVDMFMVALVIDISTSSNRSWVAAGAFTVFSLVYTVGGLRAAWAGVFASQSGIHVRNVFSNVDLRWGQIERFDIGQSGLFPKVCRIHMKDGKVLRAFGIQESNYASVRKLAIAQKIADELNKELAEHTARATSVDGELDPVAR
jgi:hypothetical protein